ncbi:MAG: hypothetical protein AABW88_00255 [Nanoarchaeota archaeon]
MRAQDLYKKAMEREADNIARIDAAAGIVILTRELTQRQLSYSSNSPEHAEIDTAIKQGLELAFETLPR